MSAKEQRVTRHAYIPPLRFHVLTPAYDAVVRWTCAERRFRKAMVSALAGRSFSRIVDLGCGTGSQLLALCEQFPASEIVGVDADGAALGLAANKVRKCVDRVSLRLANAQDLPFRDGSVAAFTSSLFFHHLEDGAKVRVLREVHRCLPLGGVFVIADWDRPASVVRRTLFNVVRSLDGFEVTRSHAQGRFGEIVARSGFEVRTVASICAPLGQITVWECDRLAIGR